MEEIYVITVLEISNTTDHIYYRILRAFLSEEQKIARKVSEEKKRQEKLNKAKQVTGKTASKVVAKPKKVVKKAPAKPAAKK